MATLNNEGEELNNYRIGAFGLREIFPTFLTSCWLRVRKPMREMYQRALGITQTDAQRVLFVDDRMQNLTPAAALGMKTIHFQSAEQLRHELHALVWRAERDTAPRSLYLYPSTGELSMQLAMIGLGRMGGNMVERLMRRGHKLVAFDRSAEVDARSIESLGATGRGGSDQVGAVARGAAHRLDHGAGGRSSRRDQSPSSCRCSRPATSSSTAATRTSTTRFVAAASSPKQRSSSSTAARAAVCGDSRTATASWSAAPMPR